ncbi:MAG: MFS transporter [Methanoregulaceae archaeon]|nr:MFS transporter [Methanoregulaceae archaeon]
METASVRNYEATFGLLMLSISLAVFMSALDGTIVNIALPTISEAFRISSSLVSWVATAYLLVMAGCVLIFGKISDVIGYRKVFLSGFVIFTIGSFACGLLPDIFGSFPVLVGSRMFQAVGGAMITAIAPAMVTAYIPMQRRGAAMGIVMTMAALGTAIGPAIGGVLTQYVSWHWIFFINVPVGILAVILGTRVIPASAGAGNLEGFDRYGAALVFSGLATLLFAVSMGESLGWTSPVILGTLAVSALALGGFIRQELKAKSPLLELHLFAGRNFLMTNLIMMLVFFSFSGINYLLPFYLKYVGGYDTSTAGLVLTSLSVAMMVAGIVAGMLFNRIGARLLSIGAGAFLVAGYFMMTRLRVDTSIGFVVLCLTVIGFGLGLIVTPVSNMIMNAVSKTYQGMVSSLLSLERFAPMTIGIAFFNLVFIQGILTIAARHDVTDSAPADIKLQVLAAGFDLAFFLTFILGIVILILAIFAREEIHPDYRSGEPEEEPRVGML